MISLLEYDTSTGQGPTSVSSIKRPSLPISIRNNKSSNIVPQGKLSRGPGQVWEEDPCKPHAVKVNQSFRLK